MNSSDNNNGSINMNQSFDDDDDDGSFSLFQVILPSTKKVHDSTSATGHAHLVLLVQDKDNLGPETATVVQWYSAGNAVRLILEHNDTI